MVAIQYTLANQQIWALRVCCAILCCELSSTVIVKMGETESVIWMSLMVTQVSGCIATIRDLRDPGWIYVVW